METDKIRNVESISEGPKHLWMLSPKKAIIKKKKILGFNIIENRYLEDNTFFIISDLGNRFDIKKGVII